MRNKIEANAAAGSTLRIFARRTLLWFAATVCCLAPLRAASQPPAPQLGAASSGLRGLATTGLPLTRPELRLSVDAGYGVTESFAPVPGVHHRGAGSLGLAVSPTPWLALALRLDGRVDMHPNDFDGRHSSGFGDPHLLVRAGHALGRSLSLGAEIDVWVPGRRAPSLAFEATTLDGRALLAYTPPDSAWVALGAIGFRLDNSARAAPDLTRLRLGDRVSLGLSDANALLVALGLARRLTSDTEIFAELSADLLVGRLAPPIRKSPMRVALGGRLPLTASMQAQLMTTFSLSQRPAVTPSDPLVPIEPRFSIMAGLRYGFGLTAQTPPPRRPAPRARAAPRPPPPSAAELSGVLLDSGGAPLNEAVVRLRRPGADERETVTDAQGRYTFPDTAPGEVELEASATGFETQTWKLEVDTTRPNLPSRTLVAKSGGDGVLRGLIRSFQSQPLRAHIEVRDGSGTRVANTDSSETGRFELELEAGDYRVVISAPGFRPHTRNVSIESNAVSILNVDLREAK